MDIWYIINEIQVQLVPHGKAVEEEVEELAGRLLKPVYAHGGKAEEDEVWRIT